MRSGHADNAAKISVSDDLGFGMLLEPIRCPAVERSGNTSITSRRSSRASRLRACSHNTTERLAGADACASIRSLKRLPMSFRSRAHALAKLPIIQPTESTNCCLGAGKPINRRRLNPRPRPSRRQWAAEHFRFPLRCRPETNINKQLLGINLV